MTHPLKRKPRLHQLCLGSIAVAPNLIAKIYRTKHISFPRPFFEFDGEKKRMRKCSTDNMRGEWVSLQDALNASGPIAEEINKHFLFVLEEVLPKTEIAF